MSPLSGGRWKYTVSAKQQQERRVNMQFNVFYKYHVSGEGNATTVSLHPLWRGAVCNVVTISSGRSGGGVAEVRSWTSEINESRRRPSIWSEATAAASQKHSRLHGSHVQEHKLVLAFLRSETFRDDSMLLIVIDHRCLNVLQSAFIHYNPDLVLSLLWRCNTWISSSLINTFLILFGSCRQLPPLPLSQCIVGQKHTHTHPKKNH